jgi:light-regulated signal transduction histidine kinase (bacteriophytochrome)
MEEKDLTKELSNGQSCAELVVKHAQNMGCGSLQIPVVVNGELWDVFAKRSILNDSK